MIVKKNQRGKFSTMYMIVKKNISGANLVFDCKKINMAKLAYDCKKKSVEQI